jgi:hypothetical protein
MLLYQPTPFVVLRTLSIICIPFRLDWERLKTTAPFRRNGHWLEAFAKAVLRTGATTPADLVDKVRNMGNSACSIERPS